MSARRENACRRSGNLELTWTQCSTPTDCETDIIQASGEKIICVQGATPGEQFLKGPLK